METKIRKIIENEVENFDGDKDEYRKQLDYNYNIYKSMDVPNLRYYQKLLRKTTQTIAVKASLYVIDFLISHKEIKIKR